MAVNLGAALFGMNYSYSGASDFFSINEQRQALASYVGKRALSGNELSPAETAQVSQIDKALDMQGEMAKTNYEVGLAMQDAAEEARRQDRQMKERLKAAGAIFV